jgi:hypothetical protein
MVRARKRLVTQLVFGHRFQQGIYEMPRILQRHQIGFQDTGYDVLPIRAAKKPDSQRPKATCSLTAWQVRRKFASASIGNSWPDKNPTFVSTGVRVSFAKQSSRGRLCAFVLLAERASWQPGGYR